ncbi:Transcription initiation factor TFIID subunit 8 [Yarrowia sp. E02]|nr:Transcription initiation factor TFIID subunit 8 [Yarrowia sp. E02]
MSVSDTEKGDTALKEDKKMEEPIDDKNKEPVEAKPSDTEGNVTEKENEKEPTPTQTASPAKAEAEEEEKKKPSTSPEPEKPAPPKLQPLEVTEEYFDFEQHLMRQGIAKILKGRNIATTKDAFSGVAELAEQYMDEICTRLVRYTRVQRRKQPSKADLRLMMQECSIRTGELEQEMEESREWPVEALELSDLGSLPRDDQADYYTRYFDARVIPTRQNNKLATYQNPRGDYNAPWLPSFPPDHTYLATPQFTSEIPNPRVLRQRLVAEGSLAEKALRNLAWTVQVDQAMVVHIDESDLDKLEDRLEVKQDKGVNGGGDVFSILENDTNKEVKKEGFGFGDALKDGLSRGSTPKLEEPVDSPKPIIKLSFKKDTDPDPFGLSKPIKPFDVEEYPEILRKKRLRWNEDGSAVVTQVGRAGAYGADLMEVDATGVDENPSLVAEGEQRKRKSLDQQYAMALYSIQKLGERRSNGSSATADIGIVNWRNDRFIK